MKKPIRIAIIVLLLSLSIFALSPIPGTNVHDFAHILGNTLELDKRIETLYHRTGVEMAVVTVEEIKNTTLEFYAVRLFEDWGIGKKGEDKGLLLLISLEPRTLRLEVGYGLEGALPDSFVGLKLDELVVPALAQNNMEGLIAFIDVLEQRIIEQKDQAENFYAKQNESLTEYNNDLASESGSLRGLVLFLIIVVIIILDLRFTGGRMLRSIIRSSSSGKGGGLGRGSSGSGRGRYGGGGRSGGGGASTKW